MDYTLRWFLFSSKNAQKKRPKILGILAIFGILGRPWPQKSEFFQVLEMISNNGEKLFLGLISRF